MEESNVSDCRQAGFIAQFLILILLGAGLVVGIYLVQNRTTLFSRASGGGVSRPVTPAAGFSIEADFDTYAGREVGISVMAHSDFDAANLFAAKLKFNKDLLRVTKIDTNTGFIKQWVEHHFDNNTGDISLVGGIPSPGFQTEIGSAGHMAVVYFQALKEGKAEISVIGDSAVYRNYDNANVIGLRQSGFITIKHSEGQGVSAPISASSYQVNPTPDLSISSLSVSGNGDVNSNGKVELSDMSKLLADFGKSGQRKADLNGDGKVNALDVLLLRNTLIKKGVLSTK